MKHNCEIIKDLIPLYCDDICSDASKKFVEEHTTECTSCFDELKKMKTDSVHVFVVSNEEKANKTVIKKVKKKIIIKRIIAVLIAVIITGGAALLAVRELTAFRPVEYSDGMIEITLNDGYPEEIRYVSEKKGYHTLHGHTQYVILNGKKQKIFVFYAIETLWDEFFDKDIPYGIWSMYDITSNDENEYDAIYYYIFDNPMFNEDPDFENKLKENGHLLWQAVE